MTDAENGVLGSEVRNEPIVNLYKYGTKTLDLFGSMSIGIKLQQPLDKGTFQCQRTHNIRLLGKVCQEELPLTISIVCY